MPELSEFDQAALDPAGDPAVASRFVRLRSAVTATTSDALSRAHGRCLDSRLGNSTIRLRLRLRSDPSSGAQIIGVDEVINFSGIPVRPVVLTCLSDELRAGPFPMPVLSSGSLPLFEGEIFVSSTL